MNVLREKLLTLYMQCLHRATLLNFYKPYVIFLDLYLIRLLAQMTIYPMQQL